MKYTIGIPVHNGEAYLRSALLSALSQSRPADEILVIDDASLDCSSEIAKSDEWGGKVRYVYNDKPSGWVDAFNRIAKLAEGDFVTILGCDDLLHKDFLYHVDRALDGNRSARFCYTGHNYINENDLLTGVSPEPHSTEAILCDGKTYAQKYLQGVFLNKHIHRFAGVAIDRNLLLNDCPIRKEAGLIADDDLFVRIGNFTSVVGISQPLGSVRCHAKSITGRLESLSLRLAEDYLFQVRSNEEHAHLDFQYIEMYQKLALKFINSLLFEGIRLGRADWIKKAITLYSTIEQEILEDASKKMSFRDRSIWKIVRAGGGLHMDVYLNVMANIKRLKKYFND